MVGVQSFSLSLLTSLRQSVHTSVRSSVRLVLSFSPNSSPAVGTFASKALRLSICSREGEDEGDKENFNDGDKLEGKKDEDEEHEGGK